MPVVNQLLQRADVYARIRRYDLETHVLEQALRLAPQSPWVYERWAILRTAEHRYASAVNMAHRGLLFARTAECRRRLWRIMALDYRELQRPADAAWAEAMQRKMQAQP